MAPYHPPMLAKMMGFFLLGLVRLLTGSQARWYGCPPKAEQRIYFANHQSHADLVLIWAALPEELRSITRPIAARDYWTKTPFRQWITTAVFNAIYVERQAATPPPAPAAPAHDSADGTAGGSSGLSEALAYEVLARCEGASMLVASETEVMLSARTP